MVSPKNTELFKAAFYADLANLKRLVKYRSDLQIKVPVPGGDYSLLWKNYFVEINVLDILNWAAYGFYKYIEKESLYSRWFVADHEEVLTEGINPFEYYRKVIDCIDWVCNKFSINNFLLKDYSEFRLLRHFIPDGENWLDNDEINEALKNGYRNIDLTLINEAEKGNGISCFDLIKQGANYKIDTLDNTGKSVILNILGGDISFNLSNLIAYLHNINCYDESNMYHMLSSFISGRSR